MKVDKYSIDGKVVGQVELSDAVFGAEVNDVLVYEYIKAANANLRQGTHSAKERAEVRGGGAKPWRQKGTGRARAGSSRSPIWRGGGTIFAPTPRDYSIKLPKKIKRAAFVSIFSLKAKSGSIKVVEDFQVGGKTKEVANIGKALAVTKGLLISGRKDGEDSLLKRAIRNIPWFKYNNVERLSGRDIFYSREVILTESAVKEINEKFSGAN
ncbi:MAG TPA: 50S ribosomal protein L4 [Spirochaetota bacterium]|jgi:large subunit ribosomal protein L4|nr:50S ribosomal protein L4 [Spirochaetota bacterium]OQB00365.1 MAG: 50S ribosomal protein L4 [Spirochaetes bacterium ADurb.Bin218]HON16715.1 50S ribosomal protein L4 [Spirochaetota bacterium]HOQ10735.1 50S ribosomal protein L4 [Spirochaetota bacterium]HOV08268.1 50S ribosomal protein L4 [Spirochaetota bacterium]